MKQSKATWFEEFVIVKCLAASLGKSEDGLWGNLFQDLSPPRKSKRIFPTKETSKATLCKGIFFLSLFATPSHTASRGTSLAPEVRKLSRSCCPKSSRAMPAMRSTSRTTTETGQSGKMPRRRVSERLEGGVEDFFHVFSASRTA